MTRVTLPAPWGAAVVRGLTEAVTLPQRLPCSGEVVILQGPGLGGDSVRRATAWLLRHHPLPGLLSLVSMAELVARGEMGAARLVHSYPHPVYPGSWVHIFKQPRALAATPPLAVAPARALPSQVSA